MASGADWQPASGDCTAMRRPETCCLSFSQLAALGHDRSEGRTRRKDDFAGRAVCNVAGKRDPRAGANGIAAKRFSKVLRFIRKSIETRRKGAGTTHAAP